MTSARSLDAVSPVEGRLVRTDLLLIIGAPSGDTTCTALAAQWRWCRARRCRSYEEGRHLSEPPPHLTRAVDAPPAAERGIEFMNKSSMPFGHAHEAEAASAWVNYS